jgi:hypothetical protein
MSADSTAPRRKAPTKVAEPVRRTPMFDVRHDPLPAEPAPLRGGRDPFDDLPDGRPRAPRQPAEPTRTAPRQPTPIDRMPPAAIAAPAEPMRRTLAKNIADLHQADTLAGQLVMRAPAYRYETPRANPFDLARGRPWLLVLVALASLTIFWFASATPKTIISGFTGGSPIAASNALSKVFENQNVPAGQHAVVGAPTLSAQFIDSVLAHYNSPAQGTGKIWVEMGQRYGIDPAYALAFFIHESSAGTNPGWAGIKPGGGSTHNVGNIICAGYATCFGRFRDYDSWDSGIEDWYKLIANEYINDRGAMTVEQIIPIYAPSFENDVNNYVQTVVGLADSWRQGVVR